MSELTDVNYSLTAELQQEKYKVHELEETIELLRKPQSDYNHDTFMNTEQMDDSTKAAVQQIVKRDLFPKKKFCEPHELCLILETTRTTISSLIMDKLSIVSSRRSRFWNTYKNIVHQTIIQTRSSRIGQIRKLYMQKFQDGKGKIIPYLLIIISFSIYKSICL